VRRISSEVGKIYQQASVLKQIADIASDPEYENHAEFAKFFARELREWNQELAALPKK
jgi:hypothetical protein